MVVDAVSDDDGAMNAVEALSTEEELGRPRTRRRRRKRRHAHEGHRAQPPKKTTTTINTRTRRSGGPSEVVLEGGALLELRHDVAGEADRHRRMKRCGSSSAMRRRVSEASARRTSATVRRGAAHDHHQLTAVGFEVPAGKLFEAAARLRIRATRCPRRPRRADRRGAGSCVARSRRAARSRKASRSSSGA